MPGNPREKKYVCTLPHCSRPNLDLVQIFEHAAWYHCKVNRDEGCFDYKCKDAKCGGYFMSNFYAQNHVSKNPGHEVIQLPYRRPHFKEAWQQVNTIITEYIIPTMASGGENRSISAHSRYPNDENRTPMRGDRIPGDLGTPVHSRNLDDGGRTYPSPGGFKTPKYSHNSEDWNRTPRQGDRTPTACKTPIYCRYPNKESWTPGRENPGGFRTPVHSRYSIGGGRTPTRNKTSPPNYVQRTPMRNNITPPCLMAPPALMSMPPAPLPVPPPWMLNPPPFTSMPSVGSPHNPTAQECKPLYREEPRKHALPDAQDVFQRNIPALPERVNNDIEEYTPTSPTIMQSRPSIGPSLDNRKKPCAPPSEAFGITRAERTKPAAPKVNVHTLRPSSLSVKQSQPSNQLVDRENRVKSSSQLEKVSAAIEALRSKQAISRYGGGPVVPRIITIDAEPIPPQAGTAWMSLALSTSGQTTSVSRETSPVRRSTQSAARVRRGTKVATPKVVTKSREREQTPGYPQEPPSPRQTSKIKKPQHATTPSKPKISSTIRETYFSRRKDGINRNHVRTLAVKKARNSTPELVIKREPPEPLTSQHIGLSDRRRLSRNQLISYKEPSSSPEVKKRKKIIVSSESDSDIEMEKKSSTTRKKSTK